MSLLPRAFLAERSRLHRARIIALSFSPIKVDWIVTHQLISVKWQMIILKLFGKLLMKHKLLNQHQFNFVLNYFVISFWYSLICNLKKGLERNIFLLRRFFFQKLLKCAIKMCFLIVKTWFKSMRKLNLSYGERK